MIYLDEVTAAQASQWLRYRHQRWPDSRNPHLLVSQQTAAGTSPVGPAMIQAMFEPLGVRPVRLRQDRILDEARHTADPVHLVRVFGINESTAIYYLRSRTSAGTSPWYAHSWPTCSHMAFLRYWTLTRQILLSTAGRRILRSLKNAGQPANEDLPAVCRGGSCARDPERSFAGTGRPACLGA